MIVSGEPWRFSSFFMKVSAAALSLVRVTYAFQLHVHPVEVPAPVPEPPHPTHPLAADVTGEQRD